MPERLVFGPQPALEIGSFAQVIEGHADRCEPGVRPLVVKRRGGQITHVSLLVRVVQSGFWKRPAKATLELSRSRASPAQGRHSHIFLRLVFPRLVISSTTPRNALRTAERSPRRQTTPSSISGDNPSTYL